MFSIVLGVFFSFSFNANAFLKNAGIFEKDQKVVVLLGDQHTSMNSEIINNWQKTVEIRDTQAVLQFAQDLAKTGIQIDFALEGSDQKREEELKAMGDDAR